MYLTAVKERHPSENMRVKLMKKMLTLLAGLVLSVPAWATLEVCVHPACTLQGAGIENVLFNNNEVGNPITGETNQTNTLIDFTSTTDTLLTQGSGQSELRAQDGFIDEVTFYAQDPTIGFDHVVFNVDAAADSTIFISAIDNFAVLFDFGAFIADGSGQNFFTIGSDDLQFMTSVTILGDGITALTELQQVRVSPGTLPIPPDPGGEIPLPAAVWFFGSGLVGLGAIGRKRKQV